MTLSPQAPLNGQVLNGRSPGGHLAFGDVPIEGYWNEALAMMRENNAETGILTDDEFMPMLDRYIKIQQNGLLRVFVALRDNRLIGYAVFFIVPHMHSQKVIQAIQDVIYVRPEFRGITAVRFMKYMDSELAAIPVTMIYRNVNVNNDYSRTLKRMGYELVESGWVRRI